MIRSIANQAFVLVPSLAQNFSQDFSVSLQSRIAMLDDSVWRDAVVSKASSIKTLLDQAKNLIPNRENSDCPVR